MLELGVRVRVRVRVRVMRRVQVHCADQVTALRTRAHERRGYLRVDLT